MLSRRGLLGIGGVTIAGPLLRWPAALAGETVEIEMRGRPDGSLVWFDPVGALVRPGGSVRWTNRDPGNAHTSTAYHPANEDHPPRIPEGARPWDSGYLLPDQSFVMIPEVPGVYDYYCVPHEYAGMVGRLVVAEEGASTGAAGGIVPAGRSAEHPAAGRGDSAAGARAGTPIEPADRLRGLPALRALTRPRARPPSSSIPLRLYRVRGTPRR